LTVFYETSGVFIVGGQSHGLAPPTGSKKCHFQNVLKSPSYFYQIGFSLHQNNVKTPQMYTCGRIIDI